MGMLEARYQAQILSIALAPFLILRLIDIWRRRAHDHVQSENKGIIEMRISRMPNVAISLRNLA